MSDPEISVDAEVELEIDSEKLAASVDDEAEIEATLEDRGIVVELEAEVEIEDSE